MHAQLSDKKIGLSPVILLHSFIFSTSFLVCKDFIEALERCHLSGWNRLTGACNSDKDALNRCLRAEVCK